MNTYSDEEIVKIKEAANLIFDMIKKAKGGSSWIKINDVIITGDIGYALEFCEAVLESL